LTQKLQLPQEKLCVTYFDGSDELKLDADAETKQIWLSLGYDLNWFSVGKCTNMHFTHI